MSRLGLYLLGPSRVELDGKPVHIGRAKAVALLAYLAVERRQHSRDALAALLWPEYDQRDARADLRRTLSVLNRTLGKEWFETDRETVGLRQAQPESTEHTLWLDVNEFRQRLAASEAHGHPAAEACADCLARLTEAAEGLYRDDFLSGFTLPDAPAFDEWQRYQTQALRDELGSALERLAGCHSAGGAYDAASACAQRWLALDPTREAAHRGLMALYAQAGRRSAALRQYRACVRLLEEELGVPPSAETVALYEQLRAPGLVAVGARVTAPTPTSTSVPSPAFLREDAPPVIVQRPLFVARERELAQLSRHLDTALAGQGRVVFITGGPGRGKTTLMAEFARRAMEAHPDLLVASGVCNAYSGVGDPYLPFREALGMLTGDVEALWAAGAVSGVHARRMWGTVPLASRALLDHGPYLIDALVPGPALLSRATACAAESDDDGWLDQLRAWVKREKGEQSGLEQSALFTQLTNVLTELSAAHPLLLLLDDLQWADGGSIGLLFHLGRRLGNARVLIVGAYRPEEVAVTRDGAPHALQELLSEFWRLFGEVTLDLSQVDNVEGRRFVDSLLDAEPNRLSADFRAALHRHAGGHPLFTVELLRSMRERGDLIQNESGLWIESQALDWATLPARVEAVIEKRVARLDPDLRDLLTVASVEGERFTAQVVAQVEGASERQVLRSLSSDLGPGGHRLVWPVEETRIAGRGRFLSRFRFAHALFQEYLYTRLSAGERRLLHGEVAAALEGLYGSQSDEVAAPLALHYVEAGQTEKAIEYALRAGDKARLAYANEEAAAQYQRALELLDASGHITAESPQDTLNDWRLQALRELGRVQYWMGNISGAEGHFREAISRAERIGLPPREIVRLYWWLGETLLWLGRPDDAIRNAEEGLALLEDKATQSVEGALMYKHLATGYWQKGERARVAEYIDRMAGFIQCLPYVEELRSAYFQIVSRHAYGKKNVEEGMKWVQILERHAHQHHDLRALAAVYISTANIMLQTGDGQGAIPRLERALKLLEQAGDTLLVTSFYVELGRAVLALGDLKTLEAYVRDLLETAEVKGLSKAQQYQLIGTLHLCHGAREDAVNCFRSAVQACGETFIPEKATALLALGRTRLVQGRRQEGLQHLQEAAALALQRSAPRHPAERPFLADALSALDEAHGDLAAFGAFCQRLRRENPVIGDSGLVYWHLQPATPQAFPLRLVHHRFADSPASAWAWQDPVGDCSFATGNGLEIHAANGRDLWHINLSAPRLLWQVPPALSKVTEEDLAAQTVCRPVAKQTPAIGGLLLWRDEENYLRLDRGMRGEYDISLEGCLVNKDVVIGRGRVQAGDCVSRPGGESSGAVFLRLERIGERVTALCSANGVEWFTVGQLAFPAAGPLQIGLYASGVVDRIIYPGAHPDGTAIRFDSFQLWGR